MTSTDKKANRPRYFFGRAQKLKSKATIDEVYKTGVRRISHPLAVHVVRRADDGVSRLGISIGKKSGNSPERNAIKRRLREAFRLLQHEIPIGTDYLVIVRPHAVMATGAYQNRLRQLLR